MFYQVQEIIQHGQAELEMVTEKEQVSQVTKFKKPAISTVQLQRLSIPLSAQQCFHEHWNKGKNHTREELNSPWMKYYTDQLSMSPVC